MNFIINIAEVASRNGSEAELDGMRGHTSVTEVLVSQYCCLDDGRLRVSGHVKGLKLELNRCQTEM